MSIKNSSKSLLCQHHSSQVAWEEKDGPVLTACTCAIIPRKTWESVHVWKLSVKSIRICLISSKDVAVCQLNYLHSMNVEDDCRVYEEGKDAFLQLPTSFSKSVCYEVLSFACLSINKAS